MDSVEKKLLDDSINRLIPKLMEVVKSSSLFENVSFEHNLNYCFGFKDGRNFYTSDLLRNNTFRISNSCFNKDTLVRLLTNKNYGKKMLKWIGDYIIDNEPFFKNYKFEYKNNPILHSYYYEQK